MLRFEQNLYVIKGLRYLGGTVQNVCEEIALSELGTDEFGQKRGD